MFNLFRYGVYKELDGDISLYGLEPGLKAVEYFFNDTFIDFIHSENYTRALILNSPYIFTYDISDSFKSLVYDDVLKYSNLYQLPIKDTINLGLYSITYDFNGNDLLKIWFNCSTEFLMYREVITQIFCDTRFYSKSDIFYGFPHSKSCICYPIFDFREKTSVNVVTCLNICKDFHNKNKRKLKDTHLYLLNECHFGIIMNKYRFCSFVCSVPLISVDAINHYAKKELFITGTTSKIAIYGYEKFNILDTQSFVKSINFPINKDSFFIQYQDKRLVKLDEFFELFIDLNNIFLSFGELFLYKKSNNYYNYNVNEKFYFSQLDYAFDFYCENAFEYGFKSI